MTDDATEHRDLAETFDGVVVPEATPSPRTILAANPSEPPINTTL